MIRFYCAVRNLIRPGDDGYYHANHEEIKKKIWAAKDIIIFSMGQQKNGVEAWAKDFYRQAFCREQGIKCHQ
ncbi:hypothetical protein OKW24_003828 [Peribacillus simplex]|nr:hypothetical protein [Peribacillus simplex]